MLKKPENVGSEAPKSTKMPILCSKRPKTRVPDPKSAQKPRFCARNARKWGFRRQKKHKNADFVLERIGIGTGTHNRGLPAIHRARLLNTKTSYPDNSLLSTRSVSSNRGHRAGQCAPEVPRTRIRARGDLQERRSTAFCACSSPTKALIKCYK